MLAALDRMPKPTIARVHGPAFAGGTGPRRRLRHRGRHAGGEVLLLRGEARPLARHHQPVRDARHRRARRAAATSSPPRCSTPRRRCASACCPRWCRRRSWIAIDGICSEASARRRPAGACASIKDLIRDVAGRPIDDALNADTAQRIAEIRVSPEGKEGIASFLEKRKPHMVFPENPDRQPRRDRLPRDAHREAPGHPHRRGVFGRRPRRAARAAGRRGAAHRAAAGGRELSRHRRDPRRARRRAAPRRSIPATASSPRTRISPPRASEAGVVFIGPTPEAIAAMGDKAAAKRLMEKAGVPLVPGYHGENQDAAFLEKEAARIGFPVLIKPSAGGGGKGMRVVRERKEFAAALEGAQREAKSLVRRRARADRALPRAAAPHRDAGVRRLAGQRRASLRARLLGAAPPPEGARGSAGAGVHARRQRDGRSGGRRGQGDPLHAAPARSSSSPSRTAASTSWR